MANRRNLKKDIRNICDLLLDECIAVMLIRKEVDEAALDAVMTRILNVKHDYLCRVSHTEPGQARAFYRQLHTSLTAEISAIATDLQKLA